MTSNTHVLPASRAGVTSTVETSTTKGAYAIPGVGIVTDVYGAGGAGILPLTTTWVGAGTSIAATSGALPLTTGWSGVGVKVVSAAGTLPLSTGWSGGGAWSGGSLAAGTLPLTTGWSGVGAETRASSGALPLTTGWVGVSSAGIAQSAAGTFLISTGWSGATDLGAGPAILAQSFTLYDSFVPNLVSPQGLFQHMTAHEADVKQWIWGRTLAQNLTIHPSDVERASYGVTSLQTIKLALALIRAFPAVLGQNITVHQSLALAVGVQLLQQLKLIPASLPTAHYHLGLVQALTMSSAFMRFMAASLTQNLTVHPAPLAQALRNVQLAQNLTLHAALANKLVVSVTSTIDFHEIDLVKAIYRGDVLLDGVNLGALYIDASGTITTFAINTRTNAITQYENFGFNSFAQMGRKYIAASSQGVFELDGEMDNGALIPTELETGFYQMNGTKMVGIKACYIAMRGQGQVLLKITAGDGRDYIYQAKTQPGLMNTKVNIGKGLFARYFSFDLQTVGQDFDLDNIEFVPMMRSRRV